MTAQKLSYEILEISVKMLNYKKKVKPAVLNLKDGSRMTTTAYIFTAPEGIIFVNCNKQNITYRFENQKEFDNQTKLEFFNSDKEMYQEFVGMDDETWEEWNK